MDMMELGMPDIVARVSMPMAEHGIIHRTRCLNVLTKKSDADIIGIWDADVIIPKKQIQEAIKTIVNGEADVCYPYDGRFWRMGPGISERYCNTGDKDELFTSNDRGEFSNGYGGAFFANRKRYIEMGMENENFIGYGMEDSERWHRFNMLGTVARVEGPLYHLWHPRTAQSTSDHKFFEAGRKEYVKVLAMNRGELEDYVKTWEWRK